MDIAWLALQISNLGTNGLTPIRFLINLGSRLNPPQHITLELVYCAAVLREILPRNDDSLPRPPSLNSVLP